jgi:hypothetical protein
MVEERSEHNKSCQRTELAFYRPMIYWAPKVLMRANPLRGQAGGGGALKI